MFAFAQKPQPAVAVLLDSWQLYKLSFKRLWKWQFLWLIPVVFFSASSSVVPGNKLTIILQNLNQTQFSILFVIISLIVLLISLYGEAFILSRLYTIGHDNADNNPKPALILAKNKLLPIFAGYILTWLVLVVVFAVVGFIIGLLIILLSMVSGQGASASLGFASPGILVLITIIGIFLSILLFFFSLLILFDNYRVIASLKQSVKLVWGKWWRTFFILLIPSAVIFLITHLLNFLISLVTPSWNIAISLVDLVVLTILYPWFNSVVLTLFLDLKARAMKKPAVLLTPLNPIDKHE